MGIFRKQRTAPIPARGDHSTEPDPLQRVMPAVRTASSIEQQRLRRQIHGLAPMEIPTRLLAGNLRVALVENLPDAMAYIDNKKLDEWGTSFDDLYRRAIENLEGFQPDGLALREAKVEGGSTFSAFGSDDYLGTRLLTPDYFSQCPLPDLIVAINPERNVLILADATSPAAMIQAFEDASLCAEGPGVVSLRPLVGDGKNWQELELPEGHPAKTALHSLHVSDRVLQANTLGAELQQLVGPQILVEAMVGREDENRCDTAMCWREGQPSLIAQADTIAFLRQDPNQPVLYASWQAVTDVAGVLMTPTSFRPQRWRLVAFPSNEQLEQMGAQPLSSAAR